MKLKDLVPPLELCKMIPDGEFEDSALMCEATLGMASRRVLDIRIIPRQKITNNPYVDRKLGREYYIYPAPTLEEILQELVNLSAYRINVCKSWGEWHIDCCDNERLIEKDSVKNITTAALKLWLKLKGIEA